MRVYNCKQIAVHICGVYLRLTVATVASFFILFKLCYFRLMPTPLILIFVLY